MTNSKKLFNLASTLIPGGVNSPVRAFRGVDSEPLFIERGDGAYVIDADGKAYIDYVCSWGPLILGHAHPYVMQKVIESMQRGFSFGASTEIEIELAKKISESMPALEMLRFVNSGTEAAMSAIRLARGYTKRNKIIKFAGCYHGHADSLLVAAGSGGLTFSIPSSAGISENTAQHTLIAEYNRLDEVHQLFTTHGEDIAAVIVEPIAANMNLVLPKEGFLEGLAFLCKDYGSVLIFDEVITGFRVGLGGAQALYGIRPDITLLGKVIGGGFPAAAFGGRAEIMQYLAPLGPVYQAGTLSGHPVAMTAGCATLDLISAPHFYADLEEKTSRLITGLNQAAQNAQVPFHAVSIASMFGLFFGTQEKIETEKEVKKSDIRLFKRFFHGMLNAGIYLAPSAYEIGFVSSAHGEEELNQTVKAAQTVFAEMDEACIGSLQAQQA